MLNAKKLDVGGDEHEMTDDVTQASNYVQQTDADQESSMALIDTYETPRINQEKTFNAQQL